MKYLDELNALDLPTDQYAVFGSGPMAVRGIREANDLDLVVKESLWNDMQNTYTVNERGAIEIGNIEFWHDWSEWFDDINLLIDTADLIEGVRFVKLEHVLTLKRKMRRPKDLEDVKRIEDYLKSHEDDY